MSGAKFSKKTLDFLKTAGKTTSLDWLDRNKELHEEVLVEPLRELANHLRIGLADDPLARGYRFPKRGFGRLKRPMHKIGRGEPANRNWVHLNASRPSRSRFDMNPSLYFYLSDESFFSSGGLYDTTSRQIRHLRVWLAEDPPELTKLLKSKKFKTEFPNGFETDQILKTFPRAYSPDHKRIAWLRLQAYYVKRRYTKKELYSADFKGLVLENWRQALKFNELLYSALKDMPFTYSPQPRGDASDGDEPESVPTREDLWDDRL